MYYSKILSLPFILPVVSTITLTPIVDWDFSGFDDEPLITLLDPDEQIFDPISPFESFDPDITDLFALSDCSDSTADLFDPFWADESLLQARGNTCPSGPPPETTTDSTDDEETNNDNPGEGGAANFPSPEKLNSDYIYDTGFKTEIDPLRRAFSLPKAYQDERCKEYGYARYAVCSSGDFRDETKSMAYNFWPIPTYRLERCTFGEWVFGIYLFDLD